MSGIISLRSFNSATSKALSGFILFLGLLVSLSGQAESVHALYSSPASSGQQTFLPVEEAFQLSGEIRNNQAVIHFTVTPGHYLYKKRFKFTSLDSQTSLGEPQYPPGKEKFDDNFGELLEVFDHDISIQLPISSSTQVPEIEVRFQGCAEAGLCYPPHTQTLALISSDGSFSPEATTNNTGQSLNPYESNISEKAC